MKSRDPLEKGQLRKWNFDSQPTGFVVNPRQDSCFLVTGIEGVRCDTMQEGGNAESFYVEWLIGNSALVRHEEG